MLFTRSLALNLLHPGYISYDDMDIIECLLSAFPLYSEDLKIDLSQPSGRFQWFLASILFGARISEKIASKTYMAFHEVGIDTPEKILTVGWEELVESWIQAVMCAMITLLRLS